MEIFTESSGVDTSPELNSSFEMSIARRRLEMQSSGPGPTPMTPERVQPRKLVFNCSPDIDDDGNGAKNLVDNKKLPSVVLDESFLSPAKATTTQSRILLDENVVPMAMSPPYRRVKALRLFDSPATPKTIIQKSTSHTTSSSSSMVRSSSTSRMMKFLLKNNNNNNSHYNKEEADKEEHRAFENHRLLPSTSDPCDRNNSARSAMTTAVFPQHVRANMNPFTPPALMMRPKKRLRHESDLNSAPPLYTFGASKSFLRNTASPYRPAEALEDTMLEDILEIKQAAKRIALQETNISRYEKEFVELELIGSGEFGHVYRCLNRLDGCIYAVKKSIKPVAGSAYE